MVTVVVVVAIVAQVASGMGYVRVIDVRAR
jgi:hypothetical protein